MFEEQVIFIYLCCELFLQLKLVCLDFGFNQIYSTIQFLQLGHYAVLPEVNPVKNVEDQEEKWREPQD